MRRGILLLLLWAAAAEAQDRGVLRYGGIVEGDLTVAVREGRVVTGTEDDEESWPLDDFYVVEKADGTLKWSASLRDRLRGYELLARHLRREGLVRLVSASLKARAPALAQRIFEQARDLGFSGKPAAKLLKRIEKALKGRAKAKAAQRAEIQAKLERPAEPLDELLARRAAKELEKQKLGIDGLRLLREALRINANSKPALALLKERAPEKFFLGDGRAWLNWYLDLERHGVARTEGELELKRARLYWRKDLFGVLAKPVLIVTPVRDTRVLGRCLAYGRLTCRALAQMFKTDQPKKRHKSALTVFLFENRDEYKSKTGTFRPVEDPAFLEWTAGHYSPAEGITRFYWYKDRQSERRIVGTCVHELTHHWLAEQNPRYSVSQVRPKDAAGYWIVEGFAVFMQEGKYDIDRGTWSLFDPRSRSLDIVQALAKAGKGLLRWKGLYTMTARGKAALSHEPSVPVVRRWYLRKFKISHGLLYYKQAGATCQFLYHAEGGRWRRQLMDYVVNFYTGNQKMLGIQEAFGMSAAELGRRVEKFADAVGKGWRPKKK